MSGAPFWERDSAWLARRDDLISAEQAREPRAAAVASDPHAIILDATVHLAAAPVLLQEGAKIFLA